MQGWKPYGFNGSTIDARLVQPSKKVKLLNSAQQNALELTINATPANAVRLENEGFWGINAVQGRTYRLSFWAKGNYQGRIQATLCDKKGTAIYASTYVTLTKQKKGEGVAKDWTKYTATLTADANDPKAQFALVLDGKGTLCLDVVSLFPPTFKNRENGMRPDLANMLYQMHPKFMRFPGGCFVEGQITPENAFRWERTIGPIEERTGHWNVNWGYRTTDGIGFHEYLQLAEDLGAKPLYVVNVGLWHGGMTPLDSIQPWIDETLDALEYANGDTSTKYGALRAKNGHPAPFNIEYLEIGNENNQPDQRQQSDHYYERYDKFRQAIRARYPNIKLIGNVAAWGTDNPTWDSPLEVDLLDEHYYRTPGWFAEAFHKYDSYSRKGPKIYVGEYAVTNGFGDLGNMNAALGEAVYMMGMENNSDVVQLNSYAPIFVNENDAKWRPDMIRFNSHQVMGTPSYYVQMLMARNVGTQVVPVDMQNPYPAEHAPQLTPATSQAGFATWGTKATFELKDEGYKSISGSWADNADGTISQSSLGEQCVAVSKRIIDSRHYTLNYRARKDKGQEGFMIVFNYVDPQNYCWVNFGGWGNTRHGIEQISAGGKMQTATKPGKIETGRWYDVRISVDGNNVKCWLDEELIFDTQLIATTQPGLFATATIDEPTGQLIVKVANTGSQATTANIRLTNYDPKSATLIRLSSTDGNNENTLQQPTLIAPVETELSPSGNEVQLTVPAYSLNIVRMKR
jgi:alpha-L-arabinofuranosidase